MAFDCVFIDLNEVKNSGRYTRHFRDVKKSLANSKVSYQEMPVKMGDY